MRFGPAAAGFVETGEEGVAVVVGQVGQRVNAVGARQLGRLAGDDRAGGGRRVRNRRAVLAVGGETPVPPQCLHMSKLAGKVISPKPLHIRQMTVYPSSAPGL